MKVVYVINNFQKEEKIKITPLHKIDYQEKVDRNHYKIIYKLDSVKEKQFIDKVFSKSGNILRRLESNQLNFTRAFVQNKIEKYSDKIDELKNKENLNFHYHYLKSKHGKLLNLKLRLITLKMKEY